MTVQANTKDARQRFERAGEILRGREGTLRERLLSAFVGQLLELQPARDMPQDLQEPLQQLRILVAQDEVVGDTGRVSERLDEMTEEELRDVERRVLELETQLSRC